MLPGDRSGRWIARAAPLAGALLAALPPMADAALRIQSHRFDHICRVVVMADGPRGERKLYDGPVKRGDFKTFRAGDGTTICIYRNEVPERCNSRLGPPQCKTDRHSNRTTIFSIK
jgi:hypothetical protein